jgi:FkbM family methyltransferase
MTDDDTSQQSASTAHAHAGLPSLPGRGRYQLPGFYQLINGRHGVFVVNPRDYYVGHAIAIYGEYGEHEVQLFSQLVKPGDTVIEVGANIGAHTVPLAKLVGAHGQVHAFEPQPVIFQNLCANIALNSLLNVHTYSQAAGSSSGKAIVPVVDYTSLGNFGGVELLDQGPGITVPVVRLDDMFAGLPRLRLLKLDVEGWEQSVLEGAPDLIARHRPMIYLENDRLDKSQSLIEHIFALDYRLWWHTPYLYNANNYFSNTHDEYPNIGAINMLALPKEMCVYQMQGAIEATDSRWHPMRGDSR